MYSLYDFYRSTASYRVRITLNYKQIYYNLSEVHLVNNGGEQHYANYQAINPQKLIPTLKINNTDNYITQSLAIIDYLETKHPTPSIFPQDCIEKALAYSISLQISCDIHPLNNLRVLNYLTKNLNVNDAQKSDWYHHWIHEGFNAIEQKLSTIQRSKLFCLGDKITIADICLIPQIYNANRFKLDMSPYPLLNSINEYCLTLEPFKKAAP